MSQRSAPHSHVRTGVSLSGIVAALLVAIFVLAFGVMAQIRSKQQDEAKSYPSEVSVLAENRSSPGPLVESQQRGFAVYRQFCTICHGVEGRGDGFNSSQLARPPRDFSNVEFWKQTTDERVNFAISRGGPSVGKSVLMPAWGRTLSERQVTDVAAFLRTLVALANSAGGESE